MTSGFRRVKGGIGMATVGANAVFAAVTGSSIASASVFSKVSVPQMMHHDYNPRFAVGVVAGSSVLGMIIPPSAMLIIYSLVAEQSVGDMFLAGVVPGLLLGTRLCGSDLGDDTADAGLCRRPRTRRTSDVCRGVSLPPRRFPLWG